MNPLVSIVIPTYNHAHFLARALQSVLDQTYTHWEALIVDNHSKDNTDEVVNSFKEPRIRLFKIHNQGVIAASRNLGIREARGEWVAFLDSDDCWYPKKLETLMAVRQAGEPYDVLCNDEFMVDIKTGAKRLSRCGPYEDEFYKTLVVEGNRLSPSAAIVRREFLQVHDIAFSESPEHITVEDYAFWLELARMEAKFKFVHEVMGEYVIHDTNNSTRLQLHWNNHRALIREHIYNIQRFHQNPDALWKQVDSRLSLMQARQLMENGQTAEALTLAFKAVMRSPMIAGAYFFSKFKKRLVI